MTQGKGLIALETSTPGNPISIRSSDSIELNASGAKGMINMVATKEIRGTALKINLN